MAITNDERKQVAARLRNLDERVLDCREYEHRAICTVVGCWGDGEYSGMELKDRLADLIEPEPERTCKFMPYSEKSDDGICSKCGAYMFEQDNYCPDCGARATN